MYSVGSLSIYIIYIHIYVLLLRRSTRAQLTADNGIGKRNCKSVRAPAVNRPSSRHRTSLISAGVNGPPSAVRRGVCC